MKFRVAVVAVAAVAVFGACEKDGEKRSGGIVQPAATSRSTAPTPAKAATASVFYANCAAVRAAGEAPLYRGEPGYSAKLDRDNDGIGCE